MIQPPTIPSIVVTIGRQTRLYHAFITSAPCRLDAPATMTLYASTLADVAVFAANEIVLDAGCARSCARLVLVDATELAWQRARCREAWARARFSSGCGDGCGSRGWTGTLLSVDVGSEPFTSAAAGLSRASRTGCPMDEPLHVEEECLTIRDVASRLKINEETVRRMFMNEPGVIVIYRPRKGRRQYRTLRIPERVFDRVITRFTRAG